MDNSIKEVKTKLSAKTKLGYGSGFVAASLMGDFMSGYFLYFLTTAAGVAPGIAGTIALLATIANAVANPVVGIIADKPGKNGKSRKRSFLIKSILYIGVTSLLLFSVFDLSPVFKSLYYGVIGVLFYFAYATYEVPFYALAANLTNDPDDRTSLSAYTNAISYSGSFVIGMGIPVLLDKLTIPEAFGNFGWFIIIAILLAGSAMAIFVCWKSTAFTEHIVIEEEEEVEEEKATLKDYLSLFKVRPLLMVLIGAFAYYLYYNVYNNIGYYFVTINMGLPGTTISLLNGGYTAVALIFTMLAPKVCEKVDKRKLTIGALLFSGVSFILFRIVGISTIPQIIAFYIIDCVQCGVFWVVIYTFLYDAIDIAEFKTGNRKEGTIMGLFTLICVCGQALAVQITGIALQISGFSDEAATQSVSALNMIFNCFTSIPGFFLIITAIAFIIYPVTRKRMEILQTNLELKREGKEYSTVGIEKLIK